jgi:hypothetical protein
METEIETDMKTDVGSDRGITIGTDITTAEFLDPSYTVAFSAYSGSRI